MPQSIPDAPVALDSETESWTELIGNYSKLSLDAPLDLNAFLDCDNQVLTRYTIEEADIVQIVSESNQTSGQHTSSESSDDEIQPPPPTAAEAFSAIRSISRYLDAHSSPQELYHMMASLEQFVTSSRNSHQMNITDFFSPTFASQ